MADVSNMLHIDFPGHEGRKGSFVLTNFHACKQAEAHKEKMALPSALRALSSRVAITLYYDF